MGQLYVNERDIVVPGQLLADGMDYLPSSGAYRENERIISTLLGLVNLEGRLIKIIPLRGRYMPKIGDIVIGRVVEMTFSNWFVDIGCTNNGVLSLSEVEEYVEKGTDLSTYYDFGDYIVARISNVMRNNIDLSMRGPGLRKLTPGRLLTINSSKVPRLIGKQGSMISLLKMKTGCKILVGQNGVIWVQGHPQNEMLVQETVKLVDERAHTEGLTEYITSFLDEEVKKRNLEVLPPTPEDEGRHTETSEQGDQGEYREHRGGGGGGYRGRSDHGRGGNGGGYGGGYQRREHQDFRQDFRRPMRRRPDHLLPQGMRR